MFLLVLGISVGIALGALLGGENAPQHNVAAGIAGGLIGAPAGLGLALLHVRLGMWLLGPDPPKTESRLTGILAKICECIYAFAMMFGWFLSFFCVLLMVAFLLKPGPFKPSQLSREQCLALSSSIALYGYLQMAIVHRLVIWIESRHRL
jgi:hypothetical protein